MALSVATLVASLRDEDGDVRCAAVKALAQGAAKGDTAAVQLVARSVEDSDEDVREAAFRGLASLASKGDEAALAASLRGLSDSEADVRCAAAAAAGALALPGEQEVPACLVRRLCEESEKEVRSALRHALAEVAKAEPGVVLDAVLPLVMSSSAAARREGLRALAVMAPCSDVRVLPAALELLGDGDDEVRWAAAIAVGALAQRGDVGVANALCVRLAAAESDEDVKEELLLALASTAAPGARASLSAVLPCLGDSSEAVRTAALEALAALTTATDAFALEAVGQLLQKASEAGVRRAALLAIAVLCKVLGVASAPSELRNDVRNCLGDEDEGVRRAACKAVAQMATPDDVESFSLALKLLARDEEEDVRCAAAQAVGFLALKGVKKASYPLLDALREDEDRDVRRAAAESLPAAAGQDGADDVVVALGTALEDEDSKVRAAAGVALAAIVRAAIPCTSASPLEVVELRLRHDRSDVRCSAAVGMARLAEAGVPCRRLELIAALLQDAEEWVRDESIVTLGIIARRASQESLAKLFDIVAAQCSHGASGSQGAALEALCRIVGPSDGKIGQVCEDATKAHKRFSQLLLAAFERPELEEAAARGAAELRSSLAEPTSLSASFCEVCLAGLASPSRSKRQAACKAASALWPQGNLPLAIAVYHQLSHAERNLRQAYLDCLGIVTPPEGQTTSEAIGLAAACLADSDERVRSAAVAALKKLTDQAADAGVSEIRATALATVAQHLKQGCPAARGAAAEAVAAVGATGEAAEAALLSVLAEADVTSEGFSRDTEGEDEEDVCWSALRALRSVSTAGSAAVVTAAIHWARSQDEQLRIAAVQLLADVAEAGDPEAVACLEGFTRVNGAGEDSREAVRALLKLCPDWGQERKSSNGYT